MGLMLFYKEIRNHAPYVWIFSQVLTATILIAVAKLIVLAYQGIPVWEGEGILPIVVTCWIIVVISVGAKAYIDFLCYDV